MTIQCTVSIKFDFMDCAASIDSKKTTMPWGSSYYAEMKMMQQRNAQVAPMLAARIDSLAELYDVMLVPEMVWVWRGNDDLYGDLSDPASRNKCTLMINNGKIEQLFNLNVPRDISFADYLMSDSEIMDYVAFSVVMACSPRIIPAELVSFYTLKYS